MCSCTRTIRRTTLTQHSCTGKLALGAGRMGGNEKRDPGRAIYFVRHCKAPADCHCLVCVHRTVSLCCFIIPHSACSVGAKMALSRLDWYLPLLMVVMYLMCKLNTFDRLMLFMGIHEKGEPKRGNPAHDDIIREGRALVEKARRQMGVDASAADAADAVSPHGGSTLATALSKYHARRNGEPLPDEPEQQTPAGPGRRGNRGGAAGAGVDIELGRTRAGGYDPPSIAGNSGSGGARAATRMTFDSFNAAPARDGGGTGVGGPSAAARATFGMDEPDFSNFGPTPAPAPAPAVSAWTSTAAVKSTGVSAARPAATNMSAFLNRSPAPAPAPAAGAASSAFGGGAFRGGAGVSGSGASATAAAPAPAPLVPGLRTTHGGFGGSTRGLGGPSALTGGVSAGSNTSSGVGAGAAPRNGGGPSMAAILNGKKGPGK